MERHYPDILLAGYSEDVELVAQELASYPGKLHRVCEDIDERVNVLVDSWTGAIVGYVFSRDTGYSSQLKGVFTFLQHRLRSNVQVAILLKGVAPVDMIFPEFDSVSRTSIDNVADYVIRKSPSEATSDD